MEVLIFGKIFFSWNFLFIIILVFVNSQVMSTWTNQKGFPVINVVKTATGYTLTQKRFISNPEKENSETDPSEFK